MYTHIKYIHKPLYTLVFQLPSLSQIIQPFLQATARPWPWPAPAACASPPPSGDGPGPAAATAPRAATGRSRHPPTRRWTRRKPVRGPGRAGSKAISGFLGKQKPSNSHPMGFEWFCHMSCGVLSLSFQMVP